MRTVTRKLTYLLIAGPVLLLLGQGCQRAAEETRPTPRAPFVSIDSGSPSNADLEAYFRSLQFRSDSTSSEQQPVAPGGPIATIEPEAGIHLLNETAMREGRVIARIIYSGEDTLRRVGWGPRSITYWWVKYDGDQGAGVMVSTDATTGAIQSRTPVALRSDTHPTTGEALARWARTPNGLLVGCAPCPRLGWCAGDSTRSRTWFSALVPVTRRLRGP